MAPGASIKTFEGVDNCDAALNSAISAAVNDQTVSVISLSWGACEAYSDPSFISEVDTLLAGASAMGKSIFVASGDDGAFDCGDSTISVDYPASSPYVTSVGGTSLSLSTSPVAWSTETAWSCSNVSSCTGSSGGGGGGCSAVEQPVGSWQQGVSACGGFRAVPDVAANADPGTGYTIIWNGSQNSFWGGTSFAAPVWAGIMADINQGRVGRNLPVEGFANTDLYSAGHASSQPYHDITQGGNGQYSAGAGWDPVTGWGSPDADKLALSLGAIVGSGPLVASPLTLSPGATASVSWSIANPDAWDWVALYVPGAPDSSYLAFAFLGCSQSATSAPANGACSFTMPSTPGPYEFRLFTVTWNRLATSNQIAVS